MQNLSQAESHNFVNDVLNPALKWLEFETVALQKGEAQYWRNLQMVPSSLGPSTSNPNMYSSASTKHYISGWQWMSSANNSCEIDHKSDKMMCRLARRKVTVGLWQTRCQQTTVVPLGPHFRSRGAKCSEHDRYNRKWSTEILVPQILLQLLTRTPTRCWIRRNAIRLNRTRCWFVDGRLKRSAFHA